MFLQGEPVELPMMVQAVLAQVRRNVVASEAAPDDDGLLHGVRTDIITLRSLLRMGTDADGLPKHFRRAAERIGDYKDAPVDMKDKKRAKMRKRAVTSISDLEAESDALSASLTFDPAVICYARVEHERIRILRALLEEDVSFHRFHDIRNKGFRRIFHVLKGVRLARQAADANLSPEFLALNAQLKGANQALGGLHDFTLMADSGEHPDADIRWKKRRLSMKEPLRARIREALGAIEFTYGGPELGGILSIESAAKTERETKFLEIDVDAVLRRLHELGATEKYNGRILAQYYDYDDNTLRDKNRSWRLRHKVATDEVALTAKEKLSDKHGVRVCMEHEIDVLQHGPAQYLQMQKLLLGLGMKPYREVDKHRHSFSLSGASVDIDRVVDEGHQLPPLLEIEADTNEQIAAIAGLLGLDMKHAKAWSTRKMLKHYAEKRQG